MALCVSFFPSKKSSLYGRRKWKEAVGDEAEEEMDHDDGDEVHDDLL